MTFIRASGTLFVLRKKETFQQIKYEPYYIYVMAYYIYVVWQHTATQQRNK